MSIRYVGLDVHRRQITWCILAADGAPLQGGELPLTHCNLVAFATSVLRREDVVAMEVTGNCWAVAAVLRPQVGQLIVSNPMATKAIALSKKKTDKVDARVLADLARCGYLPEVWQPDEQTRSQRELTGRRSGLVRQRIQLRNRIHGVLAARLVSLPPGDLFAGSGPPWLERTLDTLDEQAQMLIRLDLEMLRLLDAQIAAVEAELMRRGWEDKRVQLLMTLPGVDVTVAEGLLAAWGDMTRFSSAASAVSYLGLAPSTRQSAEHCYHGPITKRGNKQARWLLVQAAQHAGKHAGPVGHFFRKLKARKGHNVAVVAAARKLALIAWHMLRHNEPYRYASPRVTQDKLARLRIKATSKRRQGGVAKGTPRSQGTPRGQGGTRGVKPLSQVYLEEGLPHLREPRPGERKAVRQSGAAEYVSGLDSAHRVPRRKKATTETGGEP